MMNIIENLRKNGLKTMKLPVLALALAVGFSSCKDSKTDFPNPDETQVATFNAATNTEDVNFFLNDAKVNTDLLKLGDHVIYTKMLAGKYGAEFKTESGESLLKDSIKFDNKKAYSIFFVKGNDALEIVKIEDEMITPKEGKAGIRFVNISSDAGKLNFSIVNAEKEVETAPLFKDSDFKTATSFKEIDAKKQSFNVIDATSNEVIFTLTDVNIKAGEVYTVWVKGLKNTETLDQKIEALMFRNK